MTRKHKNETDETNLRQKNALTCEYCSVNFGSRASYYRHKQKCCVFLEEKNAEKTPDDESCDTFLSNQQNIRGDNMTIDDKDMIIERKDKLIDKLVEQNADMMKHIMTNNQITNNTNTMNNSHNHTNSHNKTFNLQFFLNETCKDAMNITDFVNSLKLNLQDLEKVGELGYAEGISRMFVRGLNDLEVTKRPIHCTDPKRETLHIKDNDKWEKETSKRDILKHAIKELSNKNIMLLDDWRKEHPGCDEYDNRKNDFYLKMMVETMGPTGESEEKRDFTKIIRAVAKNTIIQKGDDQT